MSTPDNISAKPATLRKRWVYFAFIKLPNLRAAYTFNRSVKITTSITVHNKMTVSMPCIPRPIAELMSEIQKKIGKGVSVFIRKP